MLRRTDCWRYPVAVCALAILIAGQLRAQDEKPPSQAGADKPSPEAVKLLRLNVRTFLKQHDTDKDGKLSFKEMQALFDRSDRDKDGFLDREELTDSVSQLAGKEAKVDQHVIVFMREYDVNKDSKFSSKEAKLQFNSADTDKDGLLDENELVAAGARLLPSAKKPPAVDQPPPGRPIETPAARPRPRRLMALLGVRVVLGREDVLGKVIDIVTDEEGRVVYVLVQDATSLVAVPWGAVRYSAEHRAFSVTARVNRAALKGVSFAEGRYPDFTSEAWLRGVRATWGEQALPRQPGLNTPERKLDEKTPPGKLPPKEKPRQPPQRR